VIGTEHATRNSARYNDELLRKRIKILESNGRRCAMELQGMRQEVERSRAMQNDLTVFTNENELSILRLEKDALKKRIAALETEIGFTFGKIDDKTRTRRYRTLEKSLNEYIVEIMSLEDKLSTKDSVISAMKSKGLSLRIELGHGTSTKSSTSVGQTSPAPRSRLHQKIEELKTKSKMVGQTRKETSSSARIALIRQRLKECSSASTVVHPNSSTGQHMTGLNDDKVGTEGKNLQRIDS
jgi:hypothetical protein